MKHGSAYTYRKHGCRCEPCKQARRAGRKSGTWPSCAVSFIRCVDCDALVCARYSSTLRCGPCKVKSHRERNLIRPWSKNGRCARCGSAIAISKSSRDDPICHPCRRVEPAPTRRTMRECVHCKAPFLPGNDTVVHCSRACWRSAHPKQPRKIDYTSDAERMRQHRKRVRQRAAFVEDVIPSVVFERDRWTCHLCGGKVDRRLNGNAKMGPTIDHVVPLSKGGEHSYRNVSLAHRQCNTAKGNRGGGEQLRLIG